MCHFILRSVAKTGQSHQISPKPSNASRYESKDAARIEVGKRTAEYAEAFMVALHFMHYNFVRIHKSLHTTPAMEAGVSKKLRDISDISALVADPVPAKRGSYKKKNSN